MSKGTFNSASYFRSSFALPNPGLKAFFGNVVRGQPEVYDTPFARGESTEHLLGEWMDRLESLKTQWPTLLQFEKDLAKKVGPMSVMKPLSERIDSIDSYYEGILLPSEPVRSSAIAAVEREWARVRDLVVRPQVRTVELMKKSTNSGSPYFTKRRNVLNKTVPCDVAAIGKVVTQYLHGESFNACAILGWRGQEGGPDAADVKQRVVWMFPLAVNIQELQVYQPLIEAAQNFNLIPAWVSMDAVDTHITKLFDSKSDGDLVICTDFEAFDQHINPQLSGVAKQVISDLLVKNRAAKDWIERVFPIKYNIPLAYDWEQVRFGQHGMGSGSGGTNADETILHRSLQYEAAQISGALLNTYSQCLGDDGIITFPGCTVEKVVTAYTKHGLQMNGSKQYAAQDDCVYLRRWHHKNYRHRGVCVGVYSTMRALGRLRYLERYQDPEYWDAKAVALRQLSILENVKYHPLKEELCGGR